MDGLSDGQTDLMTLRYLAYLHLCLIELQISNRPGFFKTSLCRIKSFLIFRAL